MMQVAGRSMAYTAVKQQCCHKGGKIALPGKSGSNGQLQCHNFALNIWIKQTHFLQREITSAMRVSEKLLLDIVPHFPICLVISIISVKRNKLGRLFSYSRSDILSADNQ